MSVCLSVIFIISSHPTPWGGQNSSTLRHLLVRINRSRKNNDASDQIRSSGNIKKPRTRTRTRTTGLRHRIAISIVPRERELQSTTAWSVDCCVNTTRPTSYIIDTAALTDPTPEQVHSNPVTTFYECTLHIQIHIQYPSSTDCTPQP